MKMIFDYTFRVDLEGPLNYLNYCKSETSKLQMISNVRRDKNNNNCDKVITVLKPNKKAIKITN